MKAVSSRQFEKQVSKLPKKVKQALKKKLLIFLSDEFHETLNNHKLSGEYLGYRSINISGDIRLIYKKIKDEIAFLHAIGSHSELYS